MVSLRVIVGWQLADKHQYLSWSKVFEAAIDFDDPLLELVKDRGDDGVFAAGAGGGLPEAADVGSVLGIYDKIIYNLTYQFFFGKYFGPDRLQDPAGAVESENGLVCPVRSCRQYGYRRCRGHAFFFFGVDSLRSPTLVTPESLPSM